MIHPKSLSAISTMLAAANKRISSPEYGKEIGDHKTISHQSAIQSRRAELGTNKPTITVIRKIK